MEVNLYVVGKKINKFRASNFITKIILGDLFYWGFVGSYSFDKNISFYKLVNSMKYKKYKFFLNEKEAINYLSSKIITTGDSQQNLTVSSPAMFKIQANISYSKKGVFLLKNIKLIFSKLPVEDYYAESRLLNINTFNNKKFNLSIFTNIFIKKLLVKKNNFSKLYDQDKKITTLFLANKNSKLKTLGLKKPLKIDKDSLYHIIDYFADILPKLYSKRKIRFYS